MFRTILSFVLSFLLFIQGFTYFSPAVAQKKASSTLAVLDFIANGIPESEARMLSTTFRSQISQEILSDRFKDRSDVHYTVVERSQMDKIFDELRYRSRGAPT